MSLSEHRWTASKHWSGEGTVSMNDIIVAEVRSLELAQEMVRALTAHDALVAALTQIVEAWDSIPECDQVPDEVNRDEFWEEAREALALAKPHSGGA